MLSNVFQALIDLAVKRYWNYVLLVHTDDDYGTAGAASVREYGQRKGICFSNIIKVKANPQNSQAYYRDIANQLISDPASGIIYFGDSSSG